MKTASKFFGVIIRMLAFCIAFAVATASATQNRGRDQSMGDMGNMGGMGGMGGMDGMGDMGDMGDMSSMGDQHIFEIELSMTPTADAPPNSSIRLSFEAETEDAAQTAELKLKAQNLPPGTYSVGVTLKSDGSTVALGSFTVDNEGEGEIEFGHDGTPFPTNIDPQDVASVTVSGVNGVVLFTADLSSQTTASSMNISVNAAAIAGAGVPNATGSLVLNAFLSHGKVKGSLQFTAHGLPANTSVVITVNGIPVKSLHTNKTGDVNVKLAPKGKTSTIANGITLAGVTSVALIDGNGNILLQVNL